MTVFSHHKPAIYNHYSREENQLKNRKHIGCCALLLNYITEATRLTRIMRIRLFLICVFFFKKAHFLLSVQQSPLPNVEMCRSPSGHTQLMLLFSPPPTHPAIYPLWNGSTPQSHNQSCCASTYHPVHVVFR